MTLDKGGNIMTNTNNKTSLEIIPDLAVKLGVVSIHDLRAYTTYELITLLANRINEMILNINQFGEEATESLKVMAQELDDLLRGDKVESEINKTLISWKDSGVFDHLIQSSVFNDFENRLSSVQSEMPILKQEVEKTLEETKQQIGSFNEYSLTDYPIFYKTLYGVGTSVMQQFAKLNNNTWLFSQTNAVGAPSEGESFTITRLDNDGEALDSMRLYRGGHGIFSCIQKNENIELYFTDDQNRLIKTYYQANSILDLSLSTGYTVLPKYTTERQLISIDAVNDLIMLSSRNTAKTYYKADIYSLTDYVAGIQTSPTHTLYDITPSGETIQGLAIRGDLAIFYHGAVGAKAKIRAYEVSKGTYKDYHYPKLGYTSSQNDTKTVVEAEGSFFDENGNLYIGVSTGTPGTMRANHIYVFATVKESRDFISQTLENSQTFKFTEGSGHAQWFDPKPSKLSVIQKPGWYYFMSTEFDFEDVPDEYKGVSAYWLFVSPRGKDGTVYQELVRNTAGVNQYRLTRQVLFDGTPSKWVSVRPERKTLWSGDTRTATELTLSDSIENYDWIWVRLWHEGGRYTTELIRSNQIMNDKKIHFHGLNIGDNTESISLYVFEMEVQVSEDYMTWNQVRKSRLKIDNGGTINRQEDSTIGIHEIQGIRGMATL